MMTAQRVASGLLVAFAVSFFLYSAVDTINDPVFSIDFLPYHFAGQLLARGDLAPLTDYDQSGGFFADRGPFLEAFHRHFFPGSRSALRWVYFPAYLWIFRPLAGLDFRAAALVWLVFNACMCLGSVWLLWRARRERGSTSVSGPWRLAWYLFLALTFQPVFSNLMHGQVTGLLFFLFCLGYWLLRRGHLFAAGLAFGVMTPLKFYPALFLLYFLCRRRWRVLAGAAAAGAVVVLVSMATVGFEANAAYVRLIAGELGQGGMAAFNNESLTGFLLHAFTSGDVNTWQNMDMARGLTIVRMIVVLGTLVVFGWAMRKPRGEGAVDEDLDLSLVVLFMLLASPITWYHYYMWLIFPLVVVFDRLLAMPDPPTKTIVWLALGYALTVVEGVYVIRPFAAEALQHVCLLRVMLSQSFFGAVLLAALVWTLRVESRPAVEA